MNIATATVLDDTFDGELEEFSVGAVIEFNDRLAEWMEELEPTILTADQAKEHMETFARLERLAQAALALIVLRVDATSGYAHEGARSAGAYLARLTGTTTGQANNTLETARKLDGLKETNSAFRRGELSTQQASAIASAALADPASEGGLLELATTEPLARLQDKAREVKARADRSHDQQARRHAKRCFRRFPGDDCMRRYDGLLPPEMAGEFEKVWDWFTDREFRAARSQGRKERHEAYAADGLLAMARAARDGRFGPNYTPSTGAPPETGDGTGSLWPEPASETPAAGGSAQTGRNANAAEPRPVPVHVVIRLDATAIIRGYAIPGEVCEIVGVGPIDVATAKSMFGEAIIDFVVSEGIDIKTVAHTGRKANRTQLAALLSREYVCEAEGCGRRDHLQIDHITTYASSRRTSVEELGYKCGHCHGLKTNDGWTDGPLQPNGRRKLIPPSGAPPDA